jgi:hypothetical protein
MPNGRGIRLIGSAARRRAISGTGSSPSRCSGHSTLSGSMEIPAYGPMPPPANRRATMPSTCDRTADTIDVMPTANSSTVSTDVFGA